MTDFISDSDNDSVGSLVDFIARDSEEEEDVVENKTDDEEEEWPSKSDTDEEDIIDNVPAVPQQVRRSSRVRKAPVRYQDDKFVNLMLEEVSDDAFSSSEEYHPDDDDDDFRLDDRT